MGGFKDKFVSLFNTKIPKQTLYGRGKKLRKPKTQTKIISIKSSFILKKKKIVGRMIKDRIIRDIRKLFETKEEEKEKKKLMIDQLKIE